MNQLGTVTWLVVRVSDQPADEEHHYGHGKFESLSALFVIALLYVLAGGILLAKPEQGILTLTIVVGAYFLAEGVVTIMYALEHRRELSERWSWLLISGVMDLLIAFIIVTGLPGSAQWAIGLLVGINLVLGGASLGGLDQTSAYDVATFINEKPRPDFKTKERDWPRGDPPPDVAYPTTAQRAKRAAERR